ncbi:MAG: hypothetical protein ACK55I_43925, partial [bacterium]
MQHASDDIALILLVEQIRQTTIANGDQKNEPELPSYLYGRLRALHSGLRDDPQRFDPACCILERSTRRDRG